MKNNPQLYGRYSPLYKNKKALYYKTLYKSNEVIDTLIRIRNIEAIIRKKEPYFKSSIKEQ
jgi:hypothetical protein